MKQCQFVFTALITFIYLLYVAQCQYTTIWSDNFDTLNSGWTCGNGNFGSCTDSSCVSDWAENVCFVPWFSSYCDNSPCALICAIGHGSKNRYLQRSTNITAYSALQLQFSVVHYNVNPGKCEIWYSYDGETFLNPWQGNGNGTAYNDQDTLLGSTTGSATNVTVKLQLHGNSVDCDSACYFDDIVLNGILRTDNPTQNPTQSPNPSPTASPTDNPSKNPTKSPINMPTTLPTALPTNTLLDEAAPFAIGLTFVCLIISIIILYDFIAAIKWHQWERKRIKYLGGSCLLMYSLSLLAAAASHTSYQIDAQMEQFIGIYELQLFFWGIAKCLTYIILIDRLYYLFENTGYQTNRKVTRTLYVSIGLLGIFHVQFMILSAAYYQDRISNDAFIIYRDIQVIVNCFVDGLISIVLFYLFITKLFKVSQNMYARAHQNAMVTAERVDEYNTIFFNSTIKLTVLSLLPVCVTFINFILETVLAFNSKSSVRGYNIWLWSSTSIYLYLLDTVSCILCIYMTFSIENAKLMYVKCCKGCDKSCRSLARKRNESHTQMTQVTDNYFELTDDETLTDYSVA